MGLYQQCLLCVKMRGNIETKKISESTNKAMILTMPKIQNSDKYYRKFVNQNSYQTKLKVLISVENSASSSSNNLAITLDESENMIKGIHYRH